jgi:hypothetical protein
LRDTLYLLQGIDGRYIRFAVRPPATSHQSLAAGIAYLSRADAPGKVDMLGSAATCGRMRDTLYLLQGIDGRYIRFAVRPPAEQNPYRTEQGKANDGTAFPLGVNGGQVEDQPV